jgi:ABC-2 type transport system ATP-binding protein
VGAVISVRDLRKSYGSVAAVDGVSFDVAAGEFFGILGPNGAGKTTTLEIVEGLRRADSGEVSLLGESPSPRASRSTPSPRCTAYPRRGPTRCSSRWG